MESPNFRCDPTVKYGFSVTVCDSDVDTCTDNTHVSHSATVEWSTSRQSVPEVFIKDLDTLRISNVLSPALEGGIRSQSSVTPLHYKWVQLAPQSSKLLQDSSNLFTALEGRSLVLIPGVFNGADR